MWLWTSRGRSGGCWTPRRRLCTEV
ncbi:unnamed protein product [Gulo gulo]|uniref:Uncharacterized protein n=1 Tax=Gulo gulo TaxID=48420 RepID=A0A9X9LKI1_GULGU|nr:unnamed protein product [Gulo gulo]